MISKQGWLILLVVLLVGSGDFFLVFTKNINVDCLFILVQNVFGPVLVTPLMMANNEFSSQQAKRVEWMLVSAILGAIPTTGMTIATGIDYLFSGNDKLNAIPGVKVPPAWEVFAVRVVALAVSWFCLVLLSAFSGILSSALFSRNLKT